MRSKFETENGVISATAVAVNVPEFESRATDVRLVAETTCGGNVETPIRASASVAFSELLAWIPYGPTSCDAEGAVG
jgi:hypothetical protein